MPPHTSTRRLSAAAFAVALALTLALAGATVASANSRSFRAYTTRGTDFVFRLDRVSPRVVKYGTVGVLGQHWRVGPRRLAGALRRGRLRAHTPPRVHAVLSRSISAAGKRPSSARLVLHLRGRKRATHSPAPAPQPTSTTTTTTTTTTTNTNPAPTGAGAPLPGGTAPCDAGVGSFGPGRWPSACWHPYNASSPFNRQLPANPRVAGNSGQVVDRLMSFGKQQHLLAGLADTQSDYDHPTYWSSSTDPWFTVHCTETWGTCPIEGARIQAPDSAQAAGGSDGHFTVVDQASGWEYDMWAVRSKSPGGGTINTAWGGKTRIDGDGLGSAAVAAGYGSMAGIIRQEELAAGHIDHALFMFVACDSGQHVYPAAKGGLPCSDLGQSNTGAPAMGQLFQLDLSDADINALAVPDWKKTILRAMARYGVYVGDTGGSWGLKMESGATYTDVGYPDKWVALAKQVGVPYYAPDNDYIFNMRDGVDWQRHLRVLDPCTANGSCN